MVCPLPCRRKTSRIIATLSSSAHASTTSSCERYKKPSRCIVPSFPKTYCISSQSVTSEVILYDSLNEHVAALLRLACLQSHVPSICVAGEIKEMYLCVFYMLQMRFSKTFTPLHQENVRAALSLFDSMYHDTIIVRSLPYFMRKGTWKRDVSENPCQI